MASRGKQFNEGALDIMDICEYHSVIHKPLHLLPKRFHRSEIVTRFGLFFNPYFFSNVLQEAAVKPDVIILGAATVSFLNAHWAVLPHLTLDMHKVLAELRQS